MTPDAKNETDTTTGGAMMAVKITKIDDGLSVATETTITLRHSKGKTFCDEPEALVELLNSWTREPTFENAIARVEEYWSAVPADAKAAPLSKPWYADRILRDLARVRAIVAYREPGTLRPGLLEAWIVEAVNLGALIEECVWRFGVGDSAKLGARVRAKNTAAARMRGRDIRAAADVRRTKIQEAVRKYRLKHPDQSDRTMARNLAPKLGMSASTIRALVGKKTA